ncbi:hypothetical protein [uncultured Paludibaculum sp.]|uniref:hypothetical protein n=1 Tax=uncultured Paludibaculum sp. TaxID=1765020 RepID=UPI002AAB2704|nr:hypothetical protein [uncultured Paludibaculum sp.]
MNVTLWNRLNTPGCWLAGTYLVVVIAVFALTAAATKPDNAGLDWVPFCLLSTPRYGLEPRLLFPGFFLNAGLLYLFGALLRAASRRIARY